MATEKLPDGTLVVREEFPPTIKQRQFYETCNEAESEEILFDGAVRSGKTQAACRLIAAWAWHYGGSNWKFAILRKTYRELADSTQAAFWRGDGKMPPACPPELVQRYLAKDETVILKNGAQVIFRSAEVAREAEDKIRNITLAGFFIDQVEEFEGPDYFHLYETLLSRCSDPRGPQKGLLVANPGPEDHWVYKRFVNPETRDPQTRRVSVTLFDNEQNLTRGYVRRMLRRETSNPIFYRRYILGEWGAFGGKRFPNWNPEVHVVEPFDIPSGWEIVLGIDYGWAQPTAAIWCAIDFDGRWWVVAEHYEKEKPISYHAQRMKEIERDLNIAPSSIWLDPSTWARKSEYESPGMEFADFGIYAGRAQNDRLGGWNRIEELMTEQMDDGMPRLRIFNTCKSLIAEIPSLKVRMGTDDVEKENDHASDALRYAIMSRMPTPIEQEEDEEDLTLADKFARRIAQRHEEGVTVDLV
jgi:PBSX family phage terminase large subunit